AVAPSSSSDASGNGAPWNQGLAAVGAAGAGAWANAAGASHIAAMSAPPKCRRRINVIFSSPGSWLRSLPSCCRAEARAGQGPKHRRALAVDATQPCTRIALAIGQRAAGWTSHGGGGMNAPPISVLGHAPMKTFFLRFFTWWNGATFGT